MINSVSGNGLVCEASIWTKPFPEPIMHQLRGTYMRHPASKSYQCVKFLPLFLSECCYLNTALTTISLRCMSNFKNNWNINLAKHYTLMLQYLCYSWKFTGLTQYQPLYLWFPAVCSCNGGFMGADCSVDITLPPLLHPHNHLACDGSCASMTIIGQQFVDISSLKCKFTNITVSTLWY